MSSVCFVRYGAVATLFVCCRKLSVETEADDVGWSAFE
jgi:hypothetical protein